MKSRFSKLLAGAAAAVLALTLASCTSSSEPTSPGSGSGAAETRGQMLTLGFQGAPSTMNPKDSAWGNHAPYFQAVYDTLVRIATNGDIQPMLASSWKLSDDKLTLTLNLRDDVTFTDGSKLTSSVVKANLDLYKTQGNQKALVADVASVATPDDHTAVLTLSKPNPGILLALGRSPGLMVSEKALTSPDLATNPVGSGPYVLDTAATVTGSKYVFTRNKNYWDPSLQHYENLTFSVMTDSTSMLNAIKSGAVNAANVDASTVNEVKASGWTVLTNQRDVVGLMMFDRDGKQVKALGDVRVRQAINMALDREGLLQALRGGAGTVTEQVFPPSSSGYDASLDKTYPYDPAGARRLLAEAGYGNGLTLTLPSNPRDPAAMFDLIAQQMKDVGITVNYTEVTSGLYAQIFAGKFPSAYLTTEQGSEWEVVQNMVVPEASLNPMHTTDSTVQALVERIRKGDSAAYKELNQYLVKQAWFAPTYRNDAFFGVDSKTVVQVTPMNIYPILYDFAPKK